MLYSFRFNEVSMQQVWFEAKDEEEARTLLNKIKDDQMEIGDLPQVVERNRGIELDYSVALLECDGDLLDRKVVDRG